jgi:hypothetical protein
MSGKICKIVFSGDLITGWNGGIRSLVTGWKCKNPFSGDRMECRIRYLVTGWKCKNPFSGDRMECRIRSL